MSREEARLEVMRRWPSHTLHDVMALTPAQVLALLTVEPKTADFNSMDEYERWLTKTK